MLTKEFIEEKLKTNQAWLERAVIAIYNKQTEDEKKTEETHHHNKMGFTGADAKRFSYYAKWLLRGNHLTGKHLEIAQGRMVKYSGQLLKIANKQI